MISKWWSRGFRDLFGDSIPTIGIITGVVHLGLRLLNDIFDVKSAKIVGGGIKEITKTMRRIRKRGDKKIGMQVVFTVTSSRQAPGQHHMCAYGKSAKQCVVGMQCMGQHMCTCVPSTSRGKGHPRGGMLGPVRSRYRWCAGSIASLLAMGLMILEILNFMGFSVWINKKYHIYFVIICSHEDWIFCWF